MSLILKNLNEDTFKEYIRETLEIEYDEFLDLYSDNKRNLYQAYIYDILNYNNILCWVHATILFFGNKKRKTLLDRNIDLGSE